MDSYNVICQKCFGYMQRHQDEKLAHKGWLKCGTCGFCRRTHKGDTDDKEARDRELQRADQDL